jgi:hypothetical protein
MKNLFKPFVYFNIFLFVAGLSSCQKETSIELGEAPEFGKVALNWEPVYKNNTFEFNQPYQNESGEIYTVQKFMYYIHSIALQTTDGRWRTVSAKEHFLVDFRNASSQLQEFPIQVGAYKQLRFVIGVDSSRNFSGTQTGPLDPLNGMFWAWSSGYVFAKLEGLSPDSRGPRQEFTYHIGGYKPPYVAFRTITLDLTSSGMLSIQKGTTSFLKLNADVSKWFDNQHTIRIAAQYASHSPGAFAVLVADNYAGMFIVRSIE